MVKVKDDLTGRVFGRLTVMQQSDDYVNPQGRRKSKWTCQCSCGNIVSVEWTKLKSGHTNSCKRCNTYVNCGEYTKLIVKSGAVFIVDTDDVDKIKAAIWYERPDGYAYGKMDGRLVLLHRAILNADGKEKVDHISGNIKDNRKSNLRTCTDSQNAMNCAKRKDNTSGKTGVSYDSSRSRWVVQLCVNGKRVVYKIFKDKEDAIAERIKAEKLYFGEFRREGA